MAGSTKKRRDSNPNHVHLQLESILRLRPLQKKEKGDQIVLEPRRRQDGRRVTAVMHPMAGKQKQYPESPTMKMLSPETLQLCKDTEYRLHQILAEETNQEKVYYGLGLPIARESMDFLKFKKSAKGVEKTTNLIVCMGVENSGKTHTCFGAGHGNISKRRSPDDGLVPRIIDSLFSQSTHHVQSKNKRNLSFGVRMSLIQVTQERTDQPKHHDDSIVQDLLLPSLTKAAASPMRSPSPSRLASVKNLIATLEKAKSTAVSAVSSASTQSEALVTIDQDSDTMDVTTNALVRTCRDVKEARKLLASGLHVGQRLCPRNTKAHVLTILQPVLLASDGSIERKGGKIGVLDMAGLEQSSQKKRNTAVRRHKDSVGAGTGQSDTALNAVLHCVRSLQHNSMILSGKTPALDIVDGTYDGIAIDDCTSDISCVSQEKTGKAKGPTFKVVPYRQHNLTMLLQPFFSARHIHTSKLTLLMAAYPGHRDHAEKKALLNDIDLLLEVSREPEEGVIAHTGFEKRPLSPIQFSPSSASGDGQSVDRDNRDGENALSRSDMKSSQKKQSKKSPALPSAPTLGRVPSTAYSMDGDENLVPLPPPFAPTAPPLAVDTGTATAPVAPNHHPVPNAPMVVDFPGVVLPPVKESPYAAPRAVMPHPQNLRRSFEQEPPTRSPRSPLNRNFDQPLRATTIHNVQNKDMNSNSKSKLETSPTKAWISGITGTTKHAISSAVHVSTKTGMKMMDKMRTTPERVLATSQRRPPGSAPVWPLSENKKTSSTAHGGTAANSSTPMKSELMGSVVRVSKHMTSNSPMKRGFKTKRSNENVDTAPDKVIDTLERENRNLVSRNRELEARCASLSAENSKLKRASGGNKRKSWNKDEEEAWQKSKKQLAPPSLIQPPLSQHILESKQVFDTTGRYNFAVGNDQFSLRYPTHFKRASELDLRDHQNEEDSTVNTSAASAQQESGGSGEKRKSSLHIFQKRLDSAKRKKSSLLPGVRDSRG